MTPVTPRAQLSLVKFWRFLFKGNITATIALFVISASLYALSWYTSCNGMAIKEGKKVDNTVVISSNYSDQLKKIETDKNEQIKELTSTIESIRKAPEGYNGSGKATILTPQQRRSIDKLYNRIETIKKQALEAKNEIKLNNSIQIDSNTDKVESTQSKYYNIVAIIMLVQIICNAAIMFIYRTIGQENKEISTSIQESAKNLRDECKKMAVSMVQTDMQQTFAEITKAYDSGKPSTTPPPNITEDQKKKVTPEPIQTDWEFLN